MVILPRFVLYVTGLDGAIHEMDVPSSDPQVKCTLSLFFWYAAIR